MSVTRLEDGLPVGVVDVVVVLDGCDCSWEVLGIHVAAPGEVLWWPSWMLLRRDWPACLDRHRK